MSIGVDDMGGGVDERPGRIGNETGPSRRQRADDTSADDLHEPARTVRVAVTALVIVPIVSAALRALRDDWFPIGDNALLFIRARDVWTQDHPLLGSWTSASLSVGENMNNPGAIYDWFIAPFAHLLGPGPAAAIGVASVNIAVIVGISTVSHRIGGWALQRWALLATALLAWSMGSQLLIDIWQPNAMVLPIFALLLVTVGIANGDDTLLPWAVLLTTVLLQTYLSSAYVFVVLVGAAVGVRLWLRPPSVWRRPVALSVGLLAVLWAPSVYEQLFGTGKGNLARLVGNSSGGDVSLGVATAARIIGGLATLPPWWGRPGYTTTVPVTRLEADGRTLDIPGLAPLWLGLLGLVAITATLFGLAVVSRRRGLTTQASACVISAVLLLGSVVALSRLTIGAVGISPHHARWAWPMMAFIHLSIAWSAVNLWLAVRQSEGVGAAHDGARPDRTRTPLFGGVDVVALGLIVIVSLFNIPFHAQPSGPTFEYRSMPTMQRIEPAIGRLDGFGPVLFDVSNLRIFEPYSSTMMMWMQERGIEFRVDDETMVRQLGEDRRADGSETTRVFQLQGAEALTYEGPACVIGEASALSEPADSAMRDRAERAALDLATSTGSSVEDAYARVVVGEAGAIDTSERDEFDRWVAGTYALFADGDAC